MYVAWHSMVDLFPKYLSLPTLWICILTLAMAAMGNVKWLGKSGTFLIFLCFRAK